MRRYEDVTRCEDEKMREDVMMIRCDDRPPLLEEPFAQTLSGKISTSMVVLPHLCKRLPPG